MILLIIYNIAIIYALYKTNQKKNIYYNNYQQCLRALAEQDPELKKYLEGEEYDI